MMDFNTIKNIYFIGIGGIGMSALARYFKYHGKQVSGYDKTETIITRALESEGINIHFEDDPTYISDQTDVVVYTPAIPSSMKELQHCREMGLPMLKRSEVLGIITADSFNICVAGTHGKTTISTMIAHILRDSGYGCNAFLGGISSNYNSNFWYNDRKLAVVEADEYDRSFLKLNPDIAVISSMDPDHLDIYHNHDSMNEAFIEFSGKLKSNGTLYAKYGLNADFLSPSVMYYSEHDSLADIYATNIESRQGGYTFSVTGRGWRIDDIQFNMGGLHNVGNMIVSIAIAKQLEISDDRIRKAVENFKGVKRRFEFIARSAINNAQVTYIDDYAHHPGELNALISGARSSYPGHEIMIVFQPHLFSRTKDFAVEFAESLDNADEVILLPIYPARELPVEGVTSNIIVEKMNKSSRIINRDDVPEFLRDYLYNRKAGKQLLLITAGAGDIDKIVMPVKQIIEKKGY